VEGCVDSDVNGDSTFLDNLDHDEPEIERLVWVHYPESYGFKNDYETIGNGASLSLSRLQRSADFG
jgi:hypothetical protein